MKSSFKNFSALIFVLASFLLTGCGLLVDMGGGGGGSSRRVYVNDAATADSLRSSLLNGGVSFVMQPGEKYILRTDGAASTDYLQVYAASGGVYTPWQNFVDTAQDGVQSFELQDPGRTTPNYYLAFLRSNINGPGTRPTQVRFTPTVTTLASTLKVRLVMIGSLNGVDTQLDTQAQKESFANQFLAKMASLYATYGVTLETSFEILNPNGGAYTVEFTEPTAFPGTRVENTAYLYLVGNITLDGKSDDDATILGFSPREAFSFATDEVVLSIKRGTAVSIAVSAAHELGHFLGLRHTTSTDLDRRGDRDLSNDQDGFGGTSICSGLPKRMAAETTDRMIRAPDGAHYCLRSMVERCSLSCGDIHNLMFPYQCSNVPPQEAMVTEQTTFLRKNLRLY